MKRFLLPLCLLAALSLKAEEEAVQADWEVWNQGIAYYDAGDVTNALRVLRPLMASRTHAARAAEVVAALEYGLGNREEAARAAQIALRAAPADPKANRNFTRAADGILEAREEKRVEKVLKAAEGKDPGSLLRRATYDARDLMKEAAGVATNSALRQVELSDRLSKRAGELADVWLPLREVIANSVTNAEQVATILEQLGQAEAKTKLGAKQLGDLDGQAYGSLAEAEQDFTRFLKLTAMPDVAIHEGALAQSNAWHGVEEFNGRNWQEEALEYTRAFRQKFPAWARAYEQQAQADTNAPPFTAEDQAKISALADELEKVQLDCCEDPTPEGQERAAGLAEQIATLLPKSKNGQSGQNSQQQSQNQDQQQNQDQSQSDQQQDQQDQRQEQDPEEQQGEDEQEAQAAEESDDSDDEEKKEIEAILKKAQERNDEHEAEKKARMRKAPLPPNERDW